MAHSRARGIHPATTYPAILGAILGQLRTRSGLSQQELAGRIGVSQPTWSRIEKGAISPTIEQLALAGAELGLPPGDILREADRAVKEITRQGIHVETARATKPLSNGQVLIAAAALGLLVAALLKGSK